MEAKSACLRCFSWKLLFGHFWTKFVISLFEDIEFDVVFFLKISKDVSSFSSRGQVKSKCVGAANMVAVSK